MNRTFSSMPLTRPWRALLQSLLALFAISLSGVAVAIPSTVTVTSDANPSVFGQTVTLSGTVVCGAFTPTGTASFFDGVVLQGVVPLSGGVATLTTSAMTVGAHSITVIYNGDINCDPAAGGLVQNVNQNATATTLTSSPNPSASGETVTLTATVAVAPPGVGTPTGTVDFFDGAALLGTVALDGVGQATFSTSTLAAGATHSITAVYSGDAQSSTSTSAVAAQVVNAVVAPSPVPTLGVAAQVALAAMLAGLGLRSRRRRGMDS